MKLTILTNKDLRAKKPAEVIKYIADLKKSQSELNHSIYTNKENKTHQVGQLKKAIARAYTIQKQGAGEEK